jgi:hypothetical protein
MEHSAAMENIASLVSRTAPHVANDWIPSARALPQEGQPVEFVLEYRDIAMRGVYRDRVFRTRWSRYEPAAICEWRCVNSICA